MVESGIGRAMGESYQRDVCFVGCGFLVLGLGVTLAMCAVAWLVLEIVGP